MSTLTCNVVLGSKNADLLARPIIGTDLSVRLQNCLHNRGVEFVWQLAEKTESDLMKIKEFGKGSMRETNQFLAENGLECGSRLTRELKRRLGIPENGTEPTETEPLEQATGSKFPPRHVIKKKIEDLQWILDNYERIAAGLTAITDP